MDDKSINLEKELVSRLTPEQKILYLSKRIGFNSLPPTIDEVINSDQFLGNQLNIYPYWQERLKEVFPNPVFTSHTYLVVGGAIGCISGDTRIKLCNGTSPTISELYESSPNGGFYVYSKDVSSGKMVPGYCSKVWNNGIKRIVKVKYKDSSGNIGEIKCTEEHRFLTPSGYKYPRDLLVEESLDSYYFTIPTSGYYKNHSVVSVEFTDEYLNVYDLTIDKYHNYGIQDQLGNIIITHNSGKSTFSQVVAYYDLLKFLWHPNPFKFLGLSASVSPVTIRCLNISIAKAMDAIVTKLNNLIYNSPWFSELMRDHGNKLPYGIKILPAKRSKDIVSEVTLTAVLSEINEFGLKAKDIVDAVISRQYSRLKLGKGIFYHTILDSSDKSEDSPTNLFLQESGYLDETKQINAAIWETKPDMYSKETFEVYFGDSNRSPFIIPEGYDKKFNELDGDRIGRVPVDLKPLYQSDIYKALQETYGISTGIDNKFFPSKDRVINQFNLPKLTDEILKVDFYDDTEIWDLIGDKVLQAIPSDKKVYARVDLGISHDKAGLCLGCGKEIGYEKIGNKKIFSGSYMIPIAFALSRFEGQETSIDKIIKFFMKLAEHYDIGCISTDNFQCLTGETKIALLDGRDVPIKDIVDEFNSRKELYTYTLDLEKGKVCPGKIINAWKTSTKKVIRVTLDNGEVIRCTDDHRFLLKSGKYLQAKDLVPGTSLMPLYRKFDKKGYEDVMNPINDSWERILPTDHKVSKIEDLGEIEDVYDLTIDNFPNFALSSGVFVHNSVAIRQALEFVKIPKKYISVDRTDGPYVTFKNLILGGRVDICNNRLLLTEFLNLVRINSKKIDHPSVMSYVNSLDRDIQFIEDARMNSHKTIEGSKDIADAVVGCIYSMVQDGESAFSEVRSIKKSKYNNIYKTMAEMNKQRMISSRFMF